MSHSLDDDDEALLFALLSNCDAAAQWPLPTSFDGGALDGADMLIGDNSFTAMLDTRFGLSFTPPYSTANFQDQMTTTTTVDVVVDEMLVNNGDYSAAKQKKKKSAGYDTNKARNERREELIFLRKMVQSLELQLRQLKGTDAPNESSVSSSSSQALPIFAVKETSSLNLLRWSEVVEFARRRRKLQSWAKKQKNFSCLWEEIAARQYNERQRAELENIRLKLVVNTQMKLAKNLEKLLHRQTSLRNLEAIHDHKIHGVLERIDSFANDEVIFEKLRTGFENSLSDVDEVLKMNGKASLKESYQSAKVRYDKTSGAPYLVIVANKAVPFDLQSTGQAVWRHFAQAMDRVPTRFYYEKKATEVDSAADTITESFGLRLDGGRSKGDFRVWQITRKFEQEDRVVVAWRAHGEAIEVSAVAANGILLPERSYSVVMRTPDHTLIQTCYMIYPMVYGEVQDREQKLRAVTEFLLKSVAGTIGASHQMIENDLMDQVLHNAKLRVATTTTGADIDTQVLR